MHRAYRSYRQRESHVHGISACERGHGALHGFPLEQLFCDENFELFPENVILRPKTQGVLLQQWLS